MPSLKGKVAVVTGASRGGGRGIALALGEAGATVYVTGRSVKGKPTTENLSGTIDETAETVTARGGLGIPVQCDHTVDAETEALFAQVKQEQGCLDILVNNAWGGYANYYGTTFDDGTNFDAPFWEQSLERWQGMFVAGVRSHLVSSRFAVPLMLPHRQGLIVNTTAWYRDVYLGNLFYDLAKNAAKRMAYGMARELRSENIAAVALAPGFMRTERVLAACAKNSLELSASESPEYIGRAVVALAADSNVMQMSGSILLVGELAQEYGFTDIDGTQPPPFKLQDD
ncbi:MAG: SDR family NAD(P)-dependent oxidoreductase [Aphanothece sp. CMT-3BRIN-NPC111]|jgi:NAD(P)-dependent dehydrogenase (short-subunit alcohol dehydrogenase family)|nr:SDR family NAD(P)-dependent oxidoreductase [Aphanothece sp. CMT-3BRIN-NPC111]